MSENEGWVAPEKPWFKIGATTTAQEENIREYARGQGFKNLRGFWKWMESRDWDYYDIIKIRYED